MPEGGPAYSVIVPAYNEEDLLPGTLAAIREAMAGVPLPGEIIVCDNNSTDRTAAVARAAGATVAFEPHNQISRARNSGARVARGRHLVFVDADTRVPPETLLQAVSLLEAGEAVGGGSLLEFEGPSGRMGAAMVRVWTWISRRFRLAAGSFVFVRRDAFEAVGGFSERVYAAEEIWLSRAVRRWGKSRHLPFVVLDGAPVRTSGRKLDWFSPWSLLATMALLGVCPPLARSRAFCRVWYSRPAAKAAA